MYVNYMFALNLFCASLSRSDLPVPNWIYFVPVPLIVRWFVCHGYRFRGNIVCKAEIRSRPWFTIPFSMWTSSDGFRLTFQYLIICYSNKVQWKRANILSSFLNLIFFSVYRIFLWTFTYKYINVDEKS